jgi:hypothetical protein
MTLQLKNFEIQQIASVLSGLAEKNLPAKISYHVGKILRVLQGHLKDVDEARQKLLDKYAKKDKDGAFEKPLGTDGKPIDGQVVITDVPEFQREFNELMSIVLDVELSTKLRLNDLTAANIELKPIEMLALENIIEE